LDVLFTFPPVCSFGSFSSFERCGCVYVVLTLLLLPVVVCSRCLLLFVYSFDFVSLVCLFERSLRCYVVLGIVVVVTVVTLLRCWLTRCRR